MAPTATSGERGSTEDLVLPDGSRIVVVLTRSSSFVFQEVLWTSQLGPLTSPGALRHRIKRRSSSPRTIAHLPEATALHFFPFRVVTPSCSIWHMQGGAHVWHDCFGRSGSCHRVASRPFRRLWHLAFESSPPASHLPSGLNAG